MHRLEMFSVFPQLKNFEKQQADSRCILYVASMVYHACIDSLRCMKQLLFRFEQPVIKLSHRRFDLKAC